MSSARVHWDLAGRSSLTIPLAGTVQVADFQYPLVFHLEEVSEVGGETELELDADFGVGVIVKRYLLSQHSQEAPPPNERGSRVSIDALHRLCGEREEESCAVEVGVVRAEELQRRTLDGECEGREVTHVSVEEAVGLARVDLGTGVAVAIRDEKRRPIDHVDGVFEHDPFFAEASPVYLVLTRL